MYLEVILAVTFIRQIPDISLSRHQLLNGRISQGQVTVATEGGWSISTKAGICSMN
jgi:hypothetical protein